MTDIPKDTHVSTPQGSREIGRIVVLTTDGTEDQEFFYPYYRFLEEGYSVDVITPDGGEFKGKNGAGLKETKKITDVRPEQYELLYIPGGKAPGKLVKDENAVRFVRDFCNTGKTVGAICHGPLLLAAAEVIAGKNIAAWPECEKDVKEAGAKYVNEACVRDGQFITGRWPGDLPAHMRAIMELLRTKAEPRKMVA